MRLQSGTRMHGIARRRRQGGAVMVLVALAMIALVGFVGLALDLGKLYVTRSELQNSADSCALAAARDVDGVTPLAVSEAAGIAAGNINRAFFQSAAVSMTVDNNVTYATSSSGPFQSKDSTSGTLAQIGYVQCTTAVTGIANWLIQVLNLLPGVSIGPSTVSAVAVATTGHAQGLCAMPIFVCDPSIGSPGTQYAVGQWLTGKVGSSAGTYSQGSFGWANLNYNTANACSGASCLGQQLTGATCSVPNSSQVRANGNIASLDKAYNTRFGIQYNGNGAPTGQSDFTGFAYTAAAGWSGSAYSDFLTKRGSRTPYQGDPNGKSGGGSGVKTGGSPGSSAVYQAGGDRRLVVVPMVNCSNITSSAGATVTNWACVLMLDPMAQGGNLDSVHVEYRSLAGAAGSPCRTEGTPGSGGNGPLVPELIQ
ncbi:putative Flp pilus-assembly TadE/G-like protein [Trinickia symbiotica]|uniref:Pilus assembly protein TadG n=1 Tax=Trinickia symbiotica TaxID=863227 RepID=A0A2N7XA74_9BURK|nr:pilus assembly protein TadG-related protein [Trinickia symbiotica]PMS38666.1 pilus assembly protein TadG [Trinickia symbiotica]PPK46681.1 putative Flp pilus-assembly TadE/G-like protein [Trinickia symbiotica]